MDTQQIIQTLTHPGGLPVDALAEADEHREELVPIFIEELEDLILHPEHEDEESWRLFFIVHLMGQWREQRAYRPLLKLLSKSSEDRYVGLDGMITETSPRVVAAVFDGDPDPIYECALDPEVDECVRAQMFNALGLLVFEDRLDREQVAEFLRDCFMHMEPQGSNFVWEGWQETVSMLGLSDLAPLVREAYEREFICPSVSDVSDFEDDLRIALAKPGEVGWTTPDKLAPFGDTVSELSDWYCFSDEYWERRAREDIGSAGQHGLIPYGNLLSSIYAASGSRHQSIEPVSNPHRDVGRNDPCPCGSGKKFKKCCLN